MPKYTLENNPLFASETAPEEKKPGRPQKEGMARGNSAQEGLPENYTRFTCITRVDLVEKLKDYAYTERMTTKDALTELLDDAFKRVEKRYKAEGKKLLSRRKK